MTTDGYFFELTPEKVLSAVEAAGILCTGRCMALNSFENRVYDVELDIEDETQGKSPYFFRSRVVKFYRPGRWSEEQLREEHQFLRDLTDQEIPVIAPLPFPDGDTLKKTADGIYYCIFPKAAGRAPDELSDEQLVRVGRLLARIHVTGASKGQSSRVELNPSTYGRSALKFLEEGDWIPAEYLNPYRTVVDQLCRVGDQKFERVKFQKIHGDCHFGNLLWNTSGPFFLDFDDMVIGPPVQDIWLLTPGRDTEALRQREVLLSGYEQMKDFDRSTLGLIEILRGLRFVHYTGWLAKRWKDPAFPRAFPHFGTHHYWREELNTLREQVSLIS